jgi:hypothetical protein
MWSVANHHFSSACEVGDAPAYPESRRQEPHSSSYTVHQLRDYCMYWPPRRSTAWGSTRGCIVERHRFARVSRLHANLSPLSITIAEEKTVGAIVLNDPSIRLALCDGFTHGSVKICADRQVLARKDTAVDRECEGVMRDGSDVASRSSIQ